MSLLLTKMRCPACNHSDRGNILQQADETSPPAPASDAHMKLCRRCNTHKSVTEFYKSKANADGYDGRCKACDAIQCATRRKRKERVEVRFPSMLLMPSCNSRLEA